jgi:putative transposase
LPALQLSERRSRRPVGHLAPAAIRKAIKTRGHFPDEQAATKLIYLAIEKAEAKWRRNRTWTAPLAALKIHFGGRIPD